MTEKDLFNAINEIDERYVTDAWNNADPAAETVVIRESKPSRARIFGFAAAFAGLAAAACLAIYIRVNELPRGNITPPDDSGVGSSALSSFTRTASEEPMPIELLGPDGAQIRYCDVLGVTLPDGKVVAAENFDPDNWERIYCDGFTYLAQPTGENSNNIDHPTLYEDNMDRLVPNGETGALYEDNMDRLVPNGETGALSDGEFYNNSDYMRFNVGDRYGSLTVKSAMTTFRNDSPAKGKFSECVAEFEGSVTLNAYIARSPNTITVGMICVPQAGYWVLPVMSPVYSEENGKFLSKAYTGEDISGEFKYRSEYPVFHLYNPQNFYLADLFDAGKNYAAVTVKVSNVHMEFYAGSQVAAFIYADIDEIRRQTKIDDPEDALPFELYGPDHRQIEYGDVDDIVDEYMNPVPAESLAADNWDQIWCEGMCYLSAADDFNNYNSIDHADCFDPITGKFRNTYVGGPPQYNYKRYKVGESFNGLRISSAMTVFMRTPEHAPGAAPDEELAAAEKLYTIGASFDGHTTISGYLVRGNNDVLYCIPLAGEKGLPVMFPASDKNGDYIYRTFEGSIALSDGSKLFYRTEMPLISLSNKNDIDLADHLNGSGFAKVTLTLDEVSMLYTRRDCVIDANIGSIRGYGSDGSDGGIKGALPFELIGADGIRVRYEDISSAVDSYGRSIKLSELTADNWTFIKCGFAYLAEPNSSDFKRYAVGDTICGLTVTAAEASFTNFSESESTARKYTGSTASFGGVLTADTYIARYENAFYCFNNMLPTTAVNILSAKRNEPNFDPLVGFINYDNFDGEPVLKVDEKLIKGMITRLNDGEVIPVRVSLADVEIDMNGDRVSAGVYGIEER